MRDPSIATSHGGALFQSRCAIVGAVAYLWSRHSMYAVIPVGNLRAWIEPLAAMGRVRILYDGSGEAVGYYTWALLNNLAEEKLLQDDSFSMRLVDWLSGDRLWVIDALALPGYSKFLFDDMREMLLKEETKLSYVRRKGMKGAGKCVRIDLNRRGAQGSISVSRIG